MQLDNVFDSERIRSAKRLRFHCYKTAFLTTLLISLLPITLYFNAIAIALIGIYIGSNLRKSADLATPTDSTEGHYMIGQVDPNDVVRYTAFGMGYDFFLWKEKRIALERQHGKVSAPVLRDLEHTLYPDMQPYAIDDSSIVQHVAVLMPTGGGKSVFYKNVLRQYIARGGGLIAIELKGTKDYVGAIVQLCRECNRMDDLRVIALDQPEHSHSYSPVISESTRGLINQLSGVQGQSSEEFFENIGRFGTSACVLCLKLQPGGRKWRVCDLSALLVDLDLLREYVRQINPNESKYHASGRRFLLMFLSFWRLNDEWNYREYKNHMSGIMSSFLGYCHSEYDEILNVYEPDAKIIEAFTEGKIIVFTASTNTDEKGINQMSRLLMGDISLTVGQLENQGFKCPVPTPLLIDEYRGMKDTRQANAWQLFRSVGVPIYLNVQNVEMLDDRKDPSFRNTVLGNSDTLIAGSARDEATQKIICDAAGEFLYKQRTETNSRSGSAGASSASSGLVTQDNSGVGHSDGYRESRESLVTPDDLRELAVGQMLVVSKNGASRVISPLTVTEEPPEWEDMGFVKFRRESSTDRAGIYEQHTRKLEDELLAG